MRPRTFARGLQRRPRGWVVLAQLEYRPRPPGRRIVMRILEGLSACVAKHRYRYYDCIQNHSKRIEILKHFPGLLHGAPLKTSRGFSTTPPSVAGAGYRALPSTLVLCSDDALRAGHP